MNEMMSHPLDEKIRNDPDYLNSMPKNYRLMYLLSKEMQFNNTLDAVEKLSKQENWSEDEKQNQINKAVRLKDVNNWSEDEKADSSNNWYCDICDKNFKKGSKRGHLNSKRHKNKKNK